jgi:hypothetical protein
MSGSRGGRTFAASHPGDRVAPIAATPGPPAHAPADLVTQTIYCILMGAAATRGSSTLGRDQGILEPRAGWLSGLRRPFQKRVGSDVPRGFESLTCRRSVGGSLTAHPNVVANGTHHDSPVGCTLDLIRAEIRP